MRDIEEFVYRNFDDVLPYGNGTDLRVNCPFCIDEVGVDDIKHKLHISLQKETCHCFRCEYSATWVQLVMDIESCNYTSALGHLYVTPKPVLYDVPSKLSNLRGERRDHKTHRILQSQQENRYKRGTTSVRLPKNARKLYGSMPNELRAAKRYLERRGFDERYWKLYNLGYMENRIIIPIEGDYWQGRSILSNMQPKYMAPDLPTESLLFNSQALNKYSEVVITEGAFSAMAVGENAVALVGKNPTKGKVQRLLDSSVNTFIIVIEDKATSLLKLADSLMYNGKQVEIWRYTEDTDPADWVEPAKSAYTFKRKVELLLQM